MQRQIINFKQKIYENYNPVQNNKPVFPSAFSFKKRLFFLNKTATFLHLNKLLNSDNSAKFSPVSISRLEIPVFTKNLVFLQKIYSNLSQKLSLKTTQEINEYFSMNKSSIINLYQTNFNSGKKKGCEEKIGERSPCKIIDENIFNHEYREALLMNKQYMVYLYMKPNEESKVEILFQTRNDFKVWLNGLDELMKNYERVVELVKQYKIQWFIVWF